MSIHVRLRIFSGISDPEWTITRPAEEAQIRRWFAVAEQNVGGALPVGRSPITGFRGFDVTIDGRTRRVYRNRIVLPTPAFNSTSETIDDILFNTNADVLIRDFNFTPAMMASETLHAIDGLPTTCDTEDAELGFTSYRPSSWVPSPFNGNTCYNYAANVKTLNFVRPDGSQRERWTKAELRDALGRDGAGPALTNPPSAALAAPDVHYIAAVLEPIANGRGSFHFFRLDRSGTWSHKVSTDPVQQIDDQHRKLTNLCQARFRRVYELVGFYVVGQDLREKLQERGDDT